MAAMVVDDDVAAALEEGPPPPEPGSWPCAREAVEHDRRATGGPGVGEVPAGQLGLPVRDRERLRLRQPEIGEMASSSGGRN